MTQSPPPLTGRQLLEFKSIISGIEPDLQQYEATLRSLAGAASPAAGKAGNPVRVLLTGVPLFLSEAIKCYYSQAFWVKILTLVPATLFALTVRRQVTQSGPGERSRATLTLTAVVSLALWFTVAAAGRWIGFS